MHIVAPNTVAARLVSAAALVFAVTIAFASATPAGAVGTVSRPSSEQPAVSRYRPHVLANGDIPRPSWWKGSCDGGKNGRFPGSFRLGAFWDGLVACGPGSNQNPPGGAQPLVDFFPGAWGEYEWQCVELAMRWMYLAWGVHPYGANGDDIVDNYLGANPDGPALEVVANGTVGTAPQPGDVLELTDSSGFGHTEVVTASSVNSHGNGSLRVITENLNAPSDGWYELQVENWDVTGGFGNVVDWLHNPHWSLEEPLQYKLTDGTLSLQRDALRAPFQTIAANVKSAQVIGGGGSEPAPILVVVTTAGELEAGYDLPGDTLAPIAPRVTQVSAASGEGPGGMPTIGWLTRRGDFYTISGSLGATPVLQAKHATDIAIGSDSAASAPLLGYVSRTTRAYVKDGSAPFQPVATGVASVQLAAGGTAGTAHVVESYIGTHGKAFVRWGPTGRFLEIIPPGTAKTSVTDVSVSTIGADATPFVGYVTSAGDAYAAIGTTGWLQESSSARDIVTASANNADGFPILALESTAGTWSVKDGTLSAPFINDGPASEIGLSTLVVS